MASSRHHRRKFLWLVRSTIDSRRSRRWETDSFRQLAKHIHRSSPLILPLCRIIAFVNITSCERTARKRKSFRPHCSGFGVKSSFLIFRNFTTFSLRFFAIVEVYLGIFSSKTKENFSDSGIFSNLNVILE